VIGAIFSLSDGSPLPSWFALPSGMSRDQISVTITRYEATTTAAWKMRIVVQDKKTWRVLQRASGYGYWHPSSERERAPAAVYPHWIVIEASGTKEVYEQSAPNNLLKIVNKPLD
jgi:hypothetical protein